MASSQQHRCVFVGNIPYDATEEQLIQICEEVGPVVNFRLVIDRETGKPKGYGFCEYKDEETALSARRNLQGYEINGRQLRVDFAENDKGSNRNREQGLGGPGMAANIDLQKQIGGVPNLGNHPIGLPLAMTAASVMAGALGGAQVGSQLNQNGLPNQLIMGHDPLTLHLSKMSRNQLNQVIHEMKVLATQNKELARQLLLVCPQLLKALFQAQIMLGIVTPQMLHMQSIRQSSGPASQPLLQGPQLGQPPMAPNLAGLPPLAPLSSTLQNPLGQSHFSAALQLPQQRAPIPNRNQIGASAQSVLPVQSGPSIPSARPQPLDGISGGLQVQAVASSSFRPAHSTMLHQPGHTSQGSIPNPGLQPSLPSHPMPSNLGFQVGSSVHQRFLEANDKDNIVSGHRTGDGTLGGRVNTYSNLPPGSSGRNDHSDQIVFPSKLVMLDDGEGAPLKATSDSGPSNIRGISSTVAKHSPATEISEKSEKQAPQLQLPPEVESALLQQVLSLTPEQLTSLPPEQRQQVIQLQQMLR